MPDKFIIYVFAEAYAKGNFEKIEELLASEGEFNIAETIYRISEPMYLDNKLPESKVGKAISMDDVDAMIAHQEKLKTDIDTIAEYQLKIVGKEEFLDWSKKCFSSFKQLNGNREINYTFSFCEGCSNGETVFVFDNGTYPINRSAFEIATSTAYRIEANETHITCIQVCNSFKGCNNKMLMG